MAGRVKGGSNKMSRSRKPPGLAGGTAKIQLHLVETIFVAVGLNRHTGNPVNGSRDACHQAGIRRTLLVVRAV
jgi:hypothetical protein